VSRWPEVALGEVLHHRKEFIEIDDLERYRRPRVQLHAQGVVLRDEVEGAVIKTKKQQVCRADELLVAEIDAKVGGYGIVPLELDGAIVSSHYFLFAADDRKLDPHYLGWYVKTPAFGDQVQAQGSTNYAAIRPAHVLAYTMPLPPIEEQGRVVRKIERLATKSASAHRLLRISGLALGVLGKSICAQFLRAIPPGLWSPLGELAEIHGGNTPSKGNAAFWGGLIPWVSPKDVKQREIRVTADHVTDAAVSEAGARLHEPGCVLVVVRGMILAHTVPSAVLRVRATINQDMKALRPIHGLLPAYLCHVMWALNDDILELVDRSGHDTRKLTTPKLEAFRIPVPSVAEQERLVRLMDHALDDAGRLLERQDRASAAIDALMPSALAVLVRGSG
jgi:type I restriction enzyme S subunit